MMTPSDLVKRGEGFPTLSGSIAEDTEMIIGELTVGNFVVERGMARLYLVWLSRAFLNITTAQFTCHTCGFVFVNDAEDVSDACPRCGAPVVAEQAPTYPTLEAYLSYVADMTGKSRQTLFNRLRVYRVLCEERGVNPASVFELNLLSSGAARLLASADEDDEHITLADESWQATAEVALGAGSKSGALEYVKYDVLHRPKINAEIDVAAGSINVYREYLVEDDQYVVESYAIEIKGTWPEHMTEWLTKRLGARVI